MIQVKELVNTTNKEEFINKKTLRRRFAELSLSSVQHVRRGLEEDTISIVDYFIHSLIDNSGMAHVLGIITEDELDGIVDLAIISTQLIKPLALIAIDMLDELLQNL